MHAGAVGLYLALTGKRLSKPADLLRIGLATHFVKTERVPQLTQALGLRTLKRSSTKASALSGLEPMLQQFNVRPCRPDTLLCFLRGPVTWEPEEISPLFKSPLFC